MLLAFVLAACANPAAQTPTPTPTTQVILVVATPAATPTLPLLPSPTKGGVGGEVAAPTPTAFATAPANSEAAIVPILMYHHLRDLPDGASELQRTWMVAPKNFEAQMNWLAQRGFHTITMEQLVGHLRDGKPVAAKPIIISFDDGWDEQYPVAFPILKRHGFIGTFFIYTNPIDHAQFMTWAQLQEMSEAGMDIQSHSLMHPHLRVLEPDAAMKEIVESKAILEKHLGKPVVAFDYPFGEYNSTVIEMVKRAGFTSAVTLAAGYHQRADELFTLHRTRVSYTDTLDDFARRLPP
jgi:peptidoglycan/xylan/chitin deacetylase (PgdA/CDA1 family)